MKYLQRLDLWIHLICFFGCLSSSCIIFTALFPSSLFFFFNSIFYLSIKTIGAEFLQLQWDSMLIEINVCCLWLELDSLITLKWLNLPNLSSNLVGTVTDSNNWHIGTNIWRLDNYCARIGIILIYWLHYRLMMSAGFVKMSSGCPKWRDGSAMKYHFWTQPIPNRFSYLAWKLQGRQGTFKAKLSTWGSIVSEMIFPLLLFLPYRICRLIAGVNTIGLMFVIFATGINDSFVIGFGF